MARADERGRKRRPLDGMGRKLDVLKAQIKILEGQRDYWQSVGAEEELRNLASEWRKRGRAAVLLPELDARADRVKAKREAAPGTAAEGW
jgi:hypothetical protein